MHKPLFPIDATLLAKDLLGLQLPTTKADLKLAFRNAVKRLRPDLANSQANDEEFIKIKTFYTKLVEQSPAWAFADTGAQDPKTTTGHLLSELGLGLGPTVNGKDCNVCQHRGYTIIELSGLTRCTRCIGAGFAYEDTCSRCKGSGKFVKNGRPVGVCFSCRGTGKPLRPRLNLCSRCHGRGSINVPANTKEYHLCYTCKGVGEIEIFNPVIPKGRLL
jgi:DnaJ-class molecular chaperone